jgi:hypothetical protein
MSHERQGTVVRHRSSDAVLTVISDDGERLLVVRKDDDTIAWIDARDTEPLPGSTHLSEPVSQESWRFHAQQYLRDRSAFPTIDGEILRQGDPVESTGQQLISGSIGFVEGFALINSSLNVIVMNRSGLTYIPLVVAKKAQDLTD